MHASDVDLALREMRRVLDPLTDGDWTVAAGPLEWSCLQTAAHIAHDLLAYAGQVAVAAEHSYLPLDLTVRPGTSPADVLSVVEACGRLLRTACDAAAPDLRGWHWGPADVSGFVALGVNEILVHTWDITQGLRIDWQPPTVLCAAVLDRLFTEVPEGVPEGAEPVAALLWATGRAALPDRPRRTHWTVRAAVS